MLCPVNELSCTMDLDSTVIRAEALFKRFKRLVEAIDRKDHFPAPKRFYSPNHVSTTSARPQEDQSATASSTPAPAQRAQQQQRNGKSAEEPQKVITPELRSLLSRKVEKLPRTDVASQGDGFRAPKTS